MLGASLAKALKKYGVAKKISVWGRAESLRAQNAPTFPRFSTMVFDSAKDAVANAELVVVCSPTSNIPELVEQIAPYLKNGATVTDVGSVKKTICDASEKALAGSKGIFVGSHPMAGSEKIGIDYSDADLFQNRPCFVTPANDSQIRAAKLLQKIWSAVGMKVYCVSPSVHDSIVANVSHLPHIVSGLLCRTASKFENGDLRDYAGPGFRDSTRISSGNPEIWDSIIADNQSEILKSLKLFKGELENIIGAVENRDSEKIGDMLRTAKKYRDKL